MNFHTPQPSAVAAGESKIPPATAAAERHYPSAEIADLWRVSADTVRRLFEREPGVLVIGDPNPRQKRRHVTLRIPALVLERVHRRLAVAGRV